MFHDLYHVQGPVLSAMYEACQSTITFQIDICTSRYALIQFCNGHFCVKKQQLLYCKSSHVIFEFSMTGLMYTVLLNDILNNE